MKLGWGSAAIYSRPSSSLHTHAARTAVVRQKPLAPIAQVDFSGYRWFAACTFPSYEIRVASDLAAMGRRTYCPIGQKYVYFDAGKRTKQKIIKQFPLLSRYIFVGVLPGAVVNKDFHDKIYKILGDSRAPQLVPIAGLEWINQHEVGGEWDDARFRPEMSPFVKGRRVRITSGSFAGFPATVDALESEDRLRVLVEIFGRLTPVPIDPCFAEAV